MPVGTCGRRRSTILPSPAKKMLPLISSKGSLPNPRSLRMKASITPTYSSTTSTSFRPKDKPRRPLVEWLLDYFYKTDEGTYRLPASPEEEQIKKEGRSQGVSRRIKRYLAYLEQGVPVPAGERPGDATLADWIRHCKRSGMYEQGKLLYEKGGLNLESLTEESQVNADEDYQICGKMLARAGGSEKRAKRSRKAGKAEEI